MFSYFYPQEPCSADREYTPFMTTKMLATERVASLNEGRMPGSCSPVRRTRSTSTVCAFMDRLEEQTRGHTHRLQRQLTLRWSDVLANLGKVDGSCDSRAERRISHSSKYVQKSNAK